VKAGRELDALVAEKVFGKNGQDVPHYSTDIDDCQDVIKWLIDNGKVTINEDGSATLDLVGYKLREKVDLMDTAHVVCLRALVATGYDALGFWEEKENISN
jgi:hypothetical protein